MTIAVGGGDHDDTRRRRAPRFVFGVGILALLAVAGFTALGVWQLHRRVWKLGLIAEIGERLQAPAVEAPGPGSWATIDAAHDAYRRVRARGVFMAGRDTMVQAVTVLGGGSWVMTPLRTDRGFTILVNRGFIAEGRPDRAVPDAGRDVTEVTGLLRVTEPGGGFLRANDPVTDRWHSRDVAAIARARGLVGIAPYFIDADARAGDPDGPVGGLTVTALPNDHLVYALTWFTLAAMSAAAAACLARDAWRAGRRR